MKPTTILCELHSDKWVVSYQAAHTVYAFSFDDESFARMFVIGLNNCDMWLTEKELES